MAETMPIMRYISKKWKPELLGRSLKEQAELDMLSAVVNDLKVSGCMVPCYTHGDRDKIVEDTRNRLAPIVGMLNDRNYILGENLTYVDFVLLECISVINWASEG